MNLSIPSLIDKIKDFGIKRIVLFIFVLLYTYFILELHLAVGNFVSYPRNFLLFTLRPRDLSFIFEKIFFILALIYLIYNIIKGERKYITAIYWIFTLIFCIFISKYLMVHPVEIAHYFQFGLLAIFISWLIDPRRKHYRFLLTFFLTSFVGIYDEINQYFFHCPAYCRYFDFMDIWLNIIAAGMGSLFVYGFKPCPDKPFENIKPIYKIKLFYFAIALIAVVLILLFSNKLYFYTWIKVPPGGILKIAESYVIVLEREVGVFGSWQKTFHTGKFYVPGPFSGIIVIFLLMIYYATFDTNLLKYFKFNSNK